MSTTLPLREDRGSTAPATIVHHLDELERLVGQLRFHADRLSDWGRLLAERLTSGGRLLVAGNGGSAAEAQHLSAELVGRFDGDRRPYSAIALHADTSSLTAIGNDYGYAEAFARQVRAHGQPGDVLLLLTTSGRSENLLRAADVGLEAGLTVWALTGAAPNPLAARLRRDAVIALDGPTGNVQECQLAAIHALCHAFEIATGRP